MQFLSLYHAPDRVALLLCEVFFAARTTLFIEGYFDRSPRSFEVFLGPLVIDWDQGDTLRWGLLTIFDQLRALPEVIDELRALPEVIDELRALPEVIDELLALPEVIDQQRALPDVIDYYYYCYYYIIIWSPLCKAGRE